MSKEVDEAAFNDWAWTKKGEPLGYYNGPDAAKLAWRAAVAWERARCVAAVEEERALHDGTECSFQQPDCGTCQYNMAIDDALAAIRGDNGE